MTQLLTIDRAGSFSPFGSQGLSPFSGDCFDGQRPNLTFFYDGATSEVPTLGSCGLLTLKTPLGGTQPVEIPFKHIGTVRKYAGAATSTKKKITAVIAADDSCAPTKVYGAKIWQVPSCETPNPYCGWYFLDESDYSADCDTDAADRPAKIAAKINADPKAPVVATTTGTGASTALVLEAKVANTDFGFSLEGFAAPTVNAVFGFQNYTGKLLRALYGDAVFPSGTYADTKTFTVYRIPVETREAITDGAGSLAANTYRYEVREKIYDLIVDTADTESAAAGTELELILNYGKTAALYHDKFC